MGLSFKEKRARIRSRDGDNCWLCGKIVNEGLKENHPLLATLDHVVEVCRGGDHRMENLRLAHAKCNNDRSNKNKLNSQMKPSKPSKRQARKNRNFKNRINRVMNCKPLRHSIDLNEYIGKINSRLAA